MQAVAARCAPAASLCREHSGSSLTTVPCLALKPSSETDGGGKKTPHRDRGACVSMRELIIKEASHLVFLACMVFENSDEYQSTGSLLLKISYFQRQVK